MPTVMTSMLFLVFALLTAQVPKNDPNGVWESPSGSKYQVRLTGEDLQVQIVSGSNPRYLKFDEGFKQQEEVNTYAGSGSFVAKMNTGKECTFETDWQMVVVAPDHILGVATGVSANAETCAIEETSQIQLELKKVQ